MTQILSKELKATWQDVNGVFSMPKDFSIHWLWKKHNKKVSFKDCLEAYYLAIKN